MSRWPKSLSLIAFLVNAIILSTSGTNDKHWGILTTVNEADDNSLTEPISSVREVDVYMLDDHTGFHLKERVSFRDTFETDGCLGADDFGLVFHHLSSVGSTQDEARELLLQECEGDERKSTAQSIIAVSATEQVKGRGTQGREWIGTPGNMFLTIAVPMDMIHVPITLLPLKVGMIVANLAHRFLHSHGSNAKVTLKWPNDVLVNDKKVGGILIESAYDVSMKKTWFLIGIGVNVAHAPKVETTGDHRGRLATCLKDHLNDEMRMKGDGIVDQSRELARNIAQDVTKWLHLDRAPNNIVTEWEKWVDFGKEYVMRDEPGDERVIVVGVEPDGQLQVKGKDGKQRLLIADYLL